MPRSLSALANWLMAYGTDELRLAPDLDAIPALSGEREARWARVSAADFLSVAEKRMLLGLPRVADE